MRTVALCDRAWRKVAVVAFPDGDLPDAVLHETHLYLRKLGVYKNLRHDGEEVTANAFGREDCVPAYQRGEYCVTEQGPDDVFRIAVGTEVKGASE